MQGQFEKYSAVTIQTLGTDYDFSSIMHYGPKAFSRNGMPTIVPKRKAAIGQRNGFSQVDSFKINTLYECSPPGQPQPQTQRPGIVVITQSPPTTQPPTLATALPEVSTMPPKGTLAPVKENCTNTRPDCDHLAQSGKNF